MKIPLYKKFVEKSQSALISAIEIYNKPLFNYRGETFSLLAVNAWELLLKAKILKDSSNSIKSIRIYEARPSKKGGKTKKAYIKTNRSGNALTINLFDAINKIELDGQPLSQEIKLNIQALIEIRDNSAHFITPSSVLAQQIHEISSASIKNFVLLAKSWFKLDLSKGLNITLPLAFLNSNAQIESVTVSKDEQKLIQFLKNLALNSSDQDSPYSIAVKLDIKIEKSDLTTATKVQITKDPNAFPITLTEENIRKRYPFSYEELIKKLSKRYKNFKLNAKFHSIKRPLQSNAKFMTRRYLDPNNIKSAKKDYYSSAIIDEFDKHYELIK